MSRPGIIDARALYRVAAWRLINPGLDVPGFEFHWGENNFSVIRNVQTCCGAHLASYSMRTGVLSRGGGGG